MYVIIECNHINMCYEFNPNQYLILCISNCKNKIIYYIILCILYIYIHKFLNQSNE
jgi:hypothetical protein